MKYDVKWTETSLSQLKKLEKPVAERIIEKVETISEMPFRFLKPLKGVDLYVLRAGDYRVITSIEKGKMILFILEIGHRRTIYRKY
jgi:mRNA interferase RelE/StbE